MTDELQNLPDDPALLKKLLLAEREKNHYLMEQFRLIMIFLSLSQ